MKKTKIQSRLQKSLDKKEQISFFRKFTSSRIHGVVLDFNAEFVLIHQTDDFQFDGYAVLPLKTIKKVRLSAYETMYSYILEAEGRIENVGIDYPIDLTSWQTIFEAIKTQKSFAIVECEQVWIRRFLIGKIAKTSKKKLELLYFEANGIYEDYLTEQKLKEISIVRFDEDYINIFSKYVRHSNQVLPKI